MSFKYQSLPPHNEKQDAANSDTSSVTLEDPEQFTDPYKLKYEDSTFEGRLASRCIWLVHGFLLTTSFSLFVLSSVKTASTIEHVRKFSAWSPAETAVRYEQVKYNITTDANPFVGARAEVDKAWDEISLDTGDQWLSKDDISKLGMSETHLKVNHPETGEEGYRVGMEVFHQLHCLNLLRRVTYRSYYEPLGGPFSHGQEKLKAHTDHCIEVLRLNLMCNADIGLFTLYLVDGDPLPWPELNSNHVCRNFDDVKDWAMSRERNVGNMEI